MLSTTGETVQKQGRGHRMQQQQEGGGRLERTIRIVCPYGRPRCEQVLDSEDAESQAGIQIEGPAQDFETHDTKL